MRKESKLFITPQDILQIKGRKWYNNGRELTKGEIEGIKSDAEFIANTKLWKLLIVEGKYHAQKRAIVDAKTEKELKEVQEFHKVVVLFEQFIQKITDKVIS